MHMNNAKYFGFLGTVCLQMSAIPAIVQAIKTGETAPLSTLILIIIGLCACTVQEIHAKLWAYVAGSVIGIVGHVAIVVVILTR